MSSRSCCVGPRRVTYDSLLVSKHGKAVMRRPAWLSRRAPNAEQNTPFQPPSPPPSPLLSPLTQSAAQPTNPSILALARRSLIAASPCVAHPFVNTIFTSHFSAFKGAASPKLRAYSIQARISYPLSTTSLPPRPPQDHTSSPQYSISCGSIDVCITSPPLPSFGLS